MSFAAALTAAWVARVSPSVTPSCSSRRAPRSLAPAVAIPARSSGRPTCRRREVRAAAADDNDDLFSFLNDQMEKEEGEENERAGGGVATGVSNDDTPEPGSPMTGDELRLLVFKKWGKMYDTRIHQRRDQFNKLGLYLQVMWKFVGQKSFPMTEREYMEQMDAVAGLLNEWGVQDDMRAAIPASTKFPKMDTTGANAVMIPLDVEVEDSSQGDK
uniref:Uncharacterized protein n=1 Tax=Mantoniella antarctica TaxID=81844 RepID=A0A7S0XFR2_9CHLO